jgi:hypothetical protein
MLANTLRAYFSDVQVEKLLIERGQADKKAVLPSHD